MIAHLRRSMALSGLLLLAATGCKSTMVGQPGDYSWSGRNRPGPTMRQPFDPMGVEGFAQARELERGGQMAVALQGYEQVAQANPDLPAVWHRMGVAYDKVGQQQRAESCYERAIALDPTNADLWCDFGYGQFLQGNFAAAENSFRRALDINPGLSRAHNNLGLALAKMGNSSDAVQQFKMAGCDANQATTNLELAYEAPIHATQVREPVAMQPPQQLPVAMQTPQQLPVAMPQSEPLPANLPRSNEMAIAMPISEPISANASPSNDTPVVMPTLEDPVILPTDSVAKTDDEEIERLNYYATDPAVSKNPAPTPILLSPPKSPPVSEDVPKYFTKSTKESFLESKRETEDGVYNLISDSAEDDSTTSRRPAKDPSEVVRRIGDVD